MTNFQHFEKFKLHKQQQKFHNLQNFFAAELEEYAIQEQTRDSLRCDI